MTLKEAIQTLDDVIPPPNHSTVDYEHLPIAVAWATIKQTLEKQKENTENDKTNQTGNHYEPRK